MFLGMNEKRSRGFCSPGHLAKRLGHRDKRTNISKKGVMRQPKDDQNAGSHYSPRAGGTCREPIRWEVEPVCLPGRSWNRRGEAATGQRCHARQRGRTSGVSTASCLPPCAKPAERPVGQEVWDRNPGGGGRRPEEGAKREATGREVSSLKMLASSHGPGITDRVAHVRRDTAWKRRRLFQLQII